MIKLILLFFFLLLIQSAFGQNQKFVNLLGVGFQSIPARKSIPYMETNKAGTIVPSLTLENDTSGIVYQNEYLLFRNYQGSPGGIASYVKTAFVTNSEYSEFQNWVRDSIAREKIYDRIPTDEEALKYLDTDVKVIRKKIGSELSPYREERAYPFNWKMKFSYDDPELVPFLVDMYLPRPERFYKNRDFDKRKLVYKYDVPVRGGDRPLDFRTILIDHPAFWANKSLSVNDEFAVLGQIYDRILPVAPVVGLTGMQTNAFCHWKEVQLQKILNEKNLPYRVRVTLPLVDELQEPASSLTIPMKDYTSQWKITVQDYHTFVRAVRDSVLIETLYAELSHASPEEAAKLIRYKPEYFDEYEYKYRKFDPKNTELNRYWFPLTNDLNSLKKYREQLNEIENKCKEKLDGYSYFRMDIAEKSIVGNVRVRERRNSEYESNPKRLEITEIHPVTQEPVGMDRSFDWINQLRQGSGVRGHENYARFILKEEIAINPEIPIENQKPEDLVKGISYEQALAYYHWKYPIWKAKSGDNWQNFVYPNEEQFKQIQNGEQLIVPKHDIQYPTPVFRYVVTFFPAN